MVSTDELQRTLSGFTGTEHYYRYLFGLKLTDGAKYLADSAGAWWLMDIIGSWQSEIQKKHGLQPFQAWTFKLDGAGKTSAVVTCTDGNDHELTRQQIEFTDFPLPEITLYCEDGVVLLPSEH